MAYEFKATRRVEFSDTDMAGIMHYANFFRFMETAEHAFFRSLGFSIVDGKVDPPIGWPRVHAACDFKAPLHFEDEVEIHTLVSEKRSKSLSYIFKLTRLHPAPVLEVARGQLTVVCVSHVGGKMTTCNIPKAVADKIQVATVELLQ